MLLTMQQAAYIKYDDNKKNRFISEIATGYITWFSEIKKMPLCIKQRDK